MQSPNDFYFCMINFEQEDLFDEEPSHQFLFISKEFWDAGEGLDCVDEPEYLYQKLDEMFGDDSDAEMENTWNFGDRDSHQVRQQLLEVGFIENKQLENDYKE